MNSEAVFKVIEHAKLAEAKTGAFHQTMKDKVFQLHLVIGLHADDPAQCLVQFAVEYIEMAPRVMECVEACAREARTERQFNPLIREAYHFFIHPSAGFSFYTGLDGLLMKAYLCHRLIEEMYENNKSIRNSRLCTAEMTQANLLAHQLIGEPFANELDQATLITAKKITGSSDYYNLNLSPFVAQAEHQAWNWIREFWQGLLSRNNIQLHFSYRNVF